MCSDSFKDVINKISIQIIYLIYILPHFVTYTLPSHNPPNTQTIPNVATTKDLGIVLNTRLSAEDNVVSAANKARRMLFYLKRSFAALTPSIFPLLYKILIRSHVKYAIQATHPIPPCRGIGKGGEARGRASACSIWSSAPTASTILPCTLANPWRHNIPVHDYPWSLGIPHGARLYTSNPQRATRPHLQVPQAEMLYVLSPIRLHHSGCPILKKNCRLR